VFAADAVGRAAAVRRPERLDLREDPLAELVAGPRERERGVGVQALEPTRSGAGAADAEVELRSQRTLLLVGVLEARAQLRILGRDACPALDSARGLDAREGRDEERARQPVRRRKRPS